MLKSTSLKIKNLEQELEQSKQYNLELKCYIESQASKIKEQEQVITILKEKYTDSKTKLDNIRKYVEELTNEEI
jgi:hypothetical protein